MKQYLFLFLLFTSLLACDRDEILAPGQPEPSVIAKFFNADSLAQITSLLAENDSLTQKIDSALLVVNDSINNGNTDPIYETLKAELSDAKDSVKTASDQLNASQTSINEGKVRISRIVSSVNKTIEGQEDSVSFYTLPLNSLANQASMTIYILDAQGNELEQNLTLEYSITQELRNNYYIARATELSYDATRSDYDSATIICDRPDSICISNETLVLLYF